MRVKKSAHGTRASYLSNKTSELLIRRCITAFEVVDPVTQLSNREVNLAAIAKAKEMCRSNVAVRDTLLIRRVVPEVQEVIH